MTDEEPSTEQVLADRRWFVPPEEDRQRFEVMLDRPAAEKPRLRRLLSEPTVFDTED